MVEEARADGVEIVGARDLGVAAGVTAVDPAFLEERDTTDAVFLGEEICSCQAVTPATDDHHIIGRFERGRRPGRLPAAVAAKGVAGKIEEGIPLHGWSFLGQTTIAAAQWDYLGRRMKFSRR